MKKIRVALAVLLAFVLLCSMMYISAAEQIAEENWQADITQLMNPESVPSTTEIQYKHKYDEGTEVSQHDIACEITVNGVTYGCEFVFDVTGETVSDWTEVQSWLGDIVTVAARTSGSDSEALAKAIDKLIADARKNEQPDENGRLPLWASDRVNVKTLRVSTPFYPELTTDKNGEATKRLQEKLVQLGYLSGGADGFFGSQTKAAVEELESHIRDLEQDLIDNRPVATPTPLPTEAPTAAPTAEIIEIEIAEAPVNAGKDKHSLELVPKYSAVPSEAPTAEPTAAPTPTLEPMDIAMDIPVDNLHQPVTQVDGIADALLQAYLFSDEFQAVRREIDRDDEGSDVARLQRRLHNLGYSNDAADGIYGGGTARAVRIFQYYNGLAQTGSADFATLNLIFSENAQAPANPLLSLGSAGEEVKKLQTRLRELGFGKGGSDGDFGNSTLNAVQELQKYMRAREEDALRASAGIAPDADVSSQLTIEVNGIADPILLDDFYSAAFPAVPAQMQSGAAGDDVIRLQRRLSGLDFFHGTLDGDYGNATEEAVRDFQKQHKLTKSGIADAQTLSVLFSGQAQKALKPYILKVSIADQRVYAYGLDDNNEYTQLVRTMKCSTGKDATPTPKGTYKSTTGPGARWHYFKKYDCWAQYAYYIEGDIMFHSVLYGEKGGPVTRSSVNNLGRKASHGCVRLSVEDAQWIYTNCPMATQITVY